MFKLKYLDTVNIGGTGTINSTDRFNLDSISGIESHSCFSDNFDIRIRYKPGKFHGVIVYLRDKKTPVPTAKDVPDASLTFFESGKFIFRANSKVIIDNLMPCVTEYFGEDMDYRINNIIANGELNKGIECGLIQEIFPHSTKGYRMREGMNIKYDQGTFSIWYSGKVQVKGFTDEDTMRQKFDEILNTINKDYKRAKKDRLKHYELERAEPMLQTYCEAIRKAADVHNKKFTDEEVAKGKELGLNFLEVKYDKKESFGAEAKNYGWALFYLLADFCKKHVPQEKIKDMGGPTQQTLRKCRKTILEEVDRVPFL